MGDRAGTPAAAACARGARGSRRGIAREHGLEFRLAESIENHTSPWGLASIWAGSSVEYTWKGVCGCVQSAANRELNAADQRLAASFFADPPKAQDIRQSDNPRHEAGAVRGLRVGAASCPPPPRSHRRYSLYT